MQAWISTELPLRPNGEEPQRSRPRENQRKRSESRSRDQPRRQEVYPQGYDPWQLGEGLETQRRHALKILVAARKELSDYGKVAEELKRGLQSINDEYPENDATKQIEEFFETIPIIERM